MTFRSPLSQYPGKFTIFLGDISQLKLEKSFPKLDLVFFVHYQTLMNATGKITIVVTTIAPTTMDRTAVYTGQVINATGPGQPVKVG